MRSHKLLGAIAFLAMATISLAGLQDSTAGPKKAKKAVEKPLVLVINYPYQITGSAMTKIHTTLLKPDFKPAAGAVVKVNGKKMGTADENGTCIFDYKPGANKSHRLKATLVEKGRRYVVRKTFSSNARTASFRSDQLFVYTDRAVYNPGDSILIRLLAWELLANYTAIDKAEISLLLQSSSGKTFTGLKLKTNEFGVAASRIPLPPNMPEGNYELVVLYKKAREKARLRVERFVPPLMNVEHDLKRFLTPAQKSLPVQIDVSYFAGGKPADASLKLEVLNSGGKSVFTKSYQQTSPARFQLTLSQRELDAIRKKLAAEQPFKLSMEITDRFKRTSKVTRDMVFTKRPYRAVLEFDKDDYPAGEEVKLQAKVADLDGKPARGIKLQCEVKEFKVKVKAVTDDSGVAVFSFKMGKKHGTAVVTSPIMPEPLASKAVRLNSPKPMTSKVKEPPKKQGGRVKFHVTFHKDYAPVENVVHVDFTDLSGGLAVSDTIPVLQNKDGGYYAQGTIKAESWGTMLANLYVCAARRKDVKKRRKLSIKNVGFITEGQHVTVYPDTDAEIVITGLKPRVKPGEKVKFEVTVKNKGGGESALGAAVVDQAVLSLMDPLEVTPRDHFYNPQRKVISTGGAGVLTWPVVDRNWGSPWRDIAYTNWGYKGPGGWVATGGRNGGGAGGGDGFIGGAKAETASGSGGMGIATKGPAKMNMAKKSYKKAKPQMLMAEAAPAPPEAKEAEMADDGDESSLKDKSVSDRSRSKDRKGKKARPVQITVRTRFPETALWEPLLQTKNGKTTVSVQFPDAITVQQVILMATDKNGNVGLVRKDVEVRQDFFIQSGLPATLTVGDTLKVGALIQNLSGDKSSVMATLSSENLGILGPAAIPLTVENEESAAALWTITAHKPGWTTFRITAGNTKFSDPEERRIFVRPAGSPAVSVEKGTLANGSPFTGEIRLGPDDNYYTVALNVSFPNVIPALQAYEALDEAPMGLIGVTGTASRALMDVALLQWGIQNRRPSAWVTHMRQRLQRAAGELVAAQDKDGGWGWYYLPDASNSRGGYSKSVYISALALRALAEMRAADFSVEDQVLRKGIEYLMKARNKKGLWSAQGAYFWEVNAPETDWGLSADLFSIVVTAASTLADKPGADLTKLKKTLMKKLDARPDDAAFVAFVMQGLNRWATWQKDRKLQKKIAGALPFLLELKREGYWEPHWYHAYGGTVELNAQILALLDQLKPNHYDALRREIITYLLSTREAWGAWHNEAGTVHAVRALLQAGAGAVEEKASRVEIKVNGRTMRKIAVDPADPFLSAAGLRHVEVTALLHQGINEIEVIYDGSLSVPVMMEIKRWRRKSAGMVPASPGLGVKRIAPTKVSLGDPVPVTLKISADRMARMVRVVDSLPSILKADVKSLEALVKKGSISGFEIGDDSIAMIVPLVEKGIELTYTTSAVRSGTATHPGTAVSTMSDKRIRPGHFTGQTIEVLD